MEIDDDETELEGNFKLGPNTNGIKPHKEDVTVTIGELSLTVPAGDFDKDDGEFEFEGHIDGVEVEIEFEKNSRKKYDFEIEINADIGGSGPVDVTLLIGDDTGTTSVTPEYDD